MPNTNQNPIRVADLTDSVYVPRVPSKPATEPYVPAKVRNPKLLEDKCSNYVWNSPEPNPVEDNVSPDSQLGIGAAPTEPFLVSQSLPTRAPITERYEQPLTVSLRPQSNNTIAAVSAPVSSGVMEANQSAAPEQTPLGSVTSAVPSEPAKNLPSYEDEIAAKRKLEWLESFANKLEAQPFVSLPNVVPQEVVDRVSSELETTQVWGLDYHAVDMGQALDRLESLIFAKSPSYAVTANLNYAMLCAKNPRLAEFTKRASLVLCDGMPILWRSKLNPVKLPERVAGSDLIFTLTELCAERGFRVYFYGAAEGVAEKTAAKLKSLYPNLIVAGVQCPPFHSTSTEQMRSQIARIKQAKPDVLFVALGQPKGEFWIEDYLAELGVPLSIQLGASFDFVAGNSQRAPKFLQRLGLEWLYRTFKDPVRLAPRYFRNLLFLLNAIRREMIDSLS